MLKKESKQRDFFDSYVYERLLPEKHTLLDIKKTMSFSFVMEETRDLYSKDMGRPSFPPEVLFKILFLEFFYKMLRDIYSQRLVQNKPKLGPTLYRHHPRDHGNLYPYCSSVFKKS